MPLVHADRVKETSTTTGTGTYSLAGTLTGFQTFVAGIGDGNTCFYTATDGVDWECGIGTVTDASPDTLARTTILSSSNSGSAVNWGAGTRTIFCGLVAGAVRRKLTADATYYVATTGNDTTGTGSSTAPWASLQKAVDWIEQNIDTAGYAVTIDLANGTYTAGVNVWHRLVGGGDLVFLGDQSTPTNVVISTTSDDCFHVISGQYVWVTGVKMQTTTAGRCGRAEAGGQIDFSDCNFGACAKEHLRAAGTGSSISLYDDSGSTTISGGAQSFVHAIDSARIYIGLAVTVSGTPAFSVAFAVAENNATIYDEGSFSGSATGNRFNALGNGSILPTSLSLTHFPGNAVGTVSLGGVYGSYQQSTLELGALLADTTLSRLAAGVAAVEGYALPVCIYSSAKGWAHSGTTTETAYVTIVFPGSLVGPNGCIIIEYGATSNTANTNAKHHRVRFDSTSGTQIRNINLSSATNFYAWYRTDIYGKNSTSSQFIFGGTVYNTSASSAPVASSQDFSGNITLVFSVHTPTSSSDSTQIDFIRVYTMYGAAN